MRKIQVQGVHHITIVGVDRQTSIDFWEGVLGMPFVFEQPNLDNELESHLYFDPGDGRLITVFTNEERAAAPNPAVAGVDYVAASGTLTIPAGQTLPVAIALPVDRVAAAWSDEAHAVVPKPGTITLEVGRSALRQRQAEAV